jgi:hypothetical protein
MVNMLCDKQVIPSTPATTMCFTWYTSQQLNLTSGPSWQRENRHPNLRSDRTYYFVFFARRLGRSSPSSGYNHPRTRRDIHRSSRRCNGTIYPLSQQRRSGKVLQTSHSRSRRLQLTNGRECDFHRRKWRSRRIKSINFPSDGT